MPACFAEEIACTVEFSSFGARSTCQSSSPTLDSDRTETREDIVGRVEIELLKRSPLRSASSSQFSIVEAMEAIRCAKLPRFAMAAVTAGVQQLRWVCAVGTVGGLKCVRRASEVDRGEAGKKPDRRPPPLCHRSQDAAERGARIRVRARGGDERQQGPRGGRPSQC